MESELTGLNKQLVELRRMNKILISMLLALALSVPSISLAQNEIVSSQFTIQFVDSQEAGYEAKLAIDNDPATMWASAWVASNPPFPHEIVLNLNGSYLLWGLGYLARQDGLPNGNVAQFEVFGSNDGSTFFPLSTGTFINTMDLQMNTFTIPTYARFVKFRALNSVPESVGDRTSAVAAEIKIYKYNGVTDKVKPGEAFIAQATHDGSCTVGYRLYANDVVIGTQPVSALSNGIIQIPGMLKITGYYQLKISAYTMDMCGITADEKFSESIIVSVEQMLSTPGIPSILKGTPPTPVTDLFPPAPVGAKPATPPTPQPRVFTVPPAKK